MFTKMTCCRGHVLPAPYFYLRVFVQGNIGPDIRDAWAHFADWSAVDPEGRIRPEANYFCPECFFELLALMEAWRTGGLAGAKEAGGKGDG